jgi:DNA polymerase-2
MLDIQPEDNPLYPAGEVPGAHPARPGGVLLLLIGEDGSRGWYRQPFPVTFYAAGKAPRLEALEKRLREMMWKAAALDPYPPRFYYTERRDLFQSRPVRLLAIEAVDAARQKMLFDEAWRAFPDLTYYDADIPLGLRYTAATGVFPLCPCRVETSNSGDIRSIAPAGTPWQLEPRMPPLRILHMEPDTPPARGEPSAILLRYGQAEVRLSMLPARPMLVVLASILKQYDPDLLVTAWGDGWMIPRLLELSQEWNIPLPLNRHPERDVDRRKERSYFSYGQVIFRDQQVHLAGRVHIDRYNAILFHDYGLEGVYELGRVTSLPLQTAARVSPGSGISAMQITTALRMGILVPFHKQQTEFPKSAAQLLEADQGGMVYQPVPGVHRHVAELDFMSMYPSIMVHCNISPEVKAYSPLPAAGSGVQPLALERRGLIPQTLAPLLEKRLALKRAAAKMPAWDPRRKVYKAWASAHKWLLVTCFGYLGYRNARFGRIEAHEAVTAFGREALLRAKETAEDNGFEVLHMYVDGLWVRKKGCENAADFTPLLAQIEEASGLPIALEGVYHWIAFLPSRVDERLPVPNRFYGAFQDGSSKERGIEMRRRDTCRWVAGVQVELLQILYGVSDPARMRTDALQPMLGILRRRLAELRAGKVPLDSLVVSQKLSRRVEDYRSPSPAARAAKQVAAPGREMRPGQVVQFIYTLGEAGVRAWDLPTPPVPAAVDRAAYRVLLLRAAETAFYPLGITPAQIAPLLEGLEMEQELFPA